MNFMVKEVAAGYMQPEEKGMYILCKRQTPLIVSILNSRGQNDACMYVYDEMVA